MSNMPDTSGTLSSFITPYHRVFGIPHPFAPRAGIQFRAGQTGNFHRQDIMAGRYTGTAHVYNPFWLPIESRKARSEQLGG